MSQAFYIFHAKNIKLPLCDVSVDSVLLCASALAGGKKDGFLPSVSTHNETKPCWFRTSS